MIETIEKTAAIETPTERGHWRCVFVNTHILDPRDEGPSVAAGWRKLTTREWVAPKRFVSREEANVHGSKAAAWANAQNARLRRIPRWRYLRAEFFPEL